MLQNLQWEVKRAGVSNRAAGSYLSTPVVSPAIRCHRRSGWNSPLGGKSSLTLLNLRVGAQTAAKVSSKCVGRLRACSGWTDGHSLTGDEPCWCVLIAQYCLEKTSTKQHSYERCIAARWLETSWMRWHWAIFWCAAFCSGYVSETLAEQPEGSWGHDAAMVHFPSCCCTSFFDFLLHWIYQNPWFIKWSKEMHTFRYTDQGACFIAPECTKQHIESVWTQMWLWKIA